MSSDNTTSQIHHRSNHLTLSECKNENFQSNEKTSRNAYFFHAGLFTSFRYLNMVVWLEKTVPATHEESKVFFLAKLTLSFINFNP